MVAKEITGIHAVACLSVLFLSSILYYVLYRLRGTW